MKIRSNQLVPTCWNVQAWLGIPVRYVSMIARIPIAVSQYAVAPLLDKP